MTTRVCDNCGTDDNHGCWYRIEKEQLAGRSGMSGSWHFGAKNPLRGYSGRNYYRVVTVWHCALCHWKGNFLVRISEPRPKPSKNQPVAQKSREEKIRESAQDWLNEHESAPTGKLTAIPIEQIIAGNSAPTVVNPNNRSVKKRGRGFFGWIWTLIVWCFLGLLALGIAAKVFGL